MPGRAGHSVALLAVVVIVAALGVVVLALSNRIDAARARHAQRALGRQGEGLAESAIAEALESFPETIARDVPKPAFYRRLASAAQGGVVPGPLVFTRPALPYVAKRTVKLIEQEVPQLTVGQVEIAPVYYSTVLNYGEVELTAVAESAAAKVYRRVTGRYYMTVDTDGTCRVNALPIKLGVFRSADQ